MNRYRPKINITVDFYSSSISDNSYSRFQDLELESVLRERLRDDEIALLKQFCLKSDEEIALERKISKESVKRKERRLKEKIKKLNQI